MKKFISILLVIALCASFMCACDFATESPDDEVTPTAETTSTPRPTISPKPAETPESTAEPSVERGEKNGNNYVNESINVTFTKPSSWRFYSDAELAELLNVSVDMFLDPDLFDTDSIAAVYDFMASGPNGGNNIILAVENLRGNELTEAEYSEVLKYQLGFMSHISYEFEADEEVMLGDEEYLKITAKGNYSGAILYQYYYLRRVEGYMVCITATDSTNVGAEYFENMFS